MLIALTGNHLPKDTCWEDDNRVTKQGKTLSPTCTCMLQVKIKFKVDSQ